MRRSMTVFLGGAAGVAMLIVALWAWHRDEDIATRMGLHNLKVATWAVRCGAVAMVAAAEALLAGLVVGSIYKRDAFTSMLGLSAALVFVLCAASAVALGLAGR